MELTKEAIQLLLDTGKGQQQIITTPRSTFAILPSGLKLDLTGDYPPTRVIQKIELLEAASFVDYVVAFKQSHTVIFADVTEETATFRAILDYHAKPYENPASLPDYCSHVATYATKETPEWKIWKSQDRKAMTQLQFATFVEDNMSLFQTPEDSGAPTAAQLMEMVLDLNGHCDARFTSTQRLKDGQSRVSYEEDMEVKGGEMVLPSFIVGGFPVLVGSANYQVSARLKTRIQERKLVIFYETINPYLILRDAIKDAIKAIADGTKLKPFIGARA